MEIKKYYEYVTIILKKKNGLLNSNSHLRLQNLLKKICIIQLKLIVLTI